PRSGFAARPGSTSKRRRERPGIRRLSFSFLSPRGPPGDPEIVADLTQTGLVDFFARDPEFLPGRAAVLRADGAVDGTFADRSSAAVRESDRFAASDFHQA